MVNRAVRSPIFGVDPEPAERILRAVRGVSDPFDAGAPEMSLQCAEKRHRALQ